MIEHEEEERLALALAPAVHSHLLWLVGPHNQPYAYKYPPGGWAVTWARGPRGWAPACLGGGEVSWGGRRHLVPALPAAADAHAVVEEFYLGRLVVCLTPPRGPRLGPLPAPRPARSEVLQSEPRVGTCTYCGTPGVNLTYDHVVPKNRGGTGHRFNLVDSCVPCNSFKGDFLLDELPPGWPEVARRGTKTQRRAVVAAAMFARAAAVSGP